MIELVAFNTSVIIIALSGIVFLLNKIRAHLESIDNNARDEWYHRNAERLNR